MKMGLIAPKWFFQLVQCTASIKTDEATAYSSKTDANLQQDAYIIAGVVLWWHFLCQSLGFKCGVLSATLVVESQGGMSSTKVNEMLKQLRKGNSLFTEFPPVEHFRFDSLPSRGILLKFQCVAEDGQPGVTS